MTAETIIYSFRSNGTYRPVYSFCDVYKNGRVIFGSGCLLNSNEDFRGYKLLKKQDVQKIEKLIDDNALIFSIKKIEDADNPVITDGSEEILHFSDADGQRQNTLRIWNLYSHEENEYFRNATNMPNLKLLIKLHESIQKILLGNGLDEKYC